MLSLKNEKNKCEVRQYIHYLKAIALDAFASRKAKLKIMVEMKTVPLKLYILIKLGCHFFQRSHKQRYVIPSPYLAITRSK